MRAQQTNFCGCLLGLAVGDAMGYPVDERTWRQIREDYGPGGLQGYDLVNGYADITSYTQLAAFTCNGLLLAMTRGQLRGKLAPLANYIGVSDREWAVSQKPWGRPARCYCWLTCVPELCRRRCMDTRMLDTLSRPTLGTPETPINSDNTPGGLTAAIAVGLFHRQAHLSMAELDRLGAEAVALTHSGALAFLSGAALAHIVSLCLSDTSVPLREAVQSAASAVKEQFGHQYSQAYELGNLLSLALALADDPATPPVQVMEKLQCSSAAQVLAGAVYAMLIGEKSFDTAMITAVNHSGRSCAVGAITGAILGLRMGETALPEFYLDCLESAQTLRELAADMFSGCSMTRESKLFDLDWDRKYVHGGK